jgi:photosynthetic reaction center M subunit
MHGSAILSAARRPVTEHNVDVFWRNIIGYSIGEIGIHRVAFWAGAASVLFANVCIFLSGTLVYDWNAFWAFWDRIPVWSGTGAGIVLVGLGIVFSKRSDKLDPEPDLDAVENVQGLDGTIGQSTVIGFMERLFGNGKVLPIYVGVWGVIGLAAFMVCVFIILTSYMHEVGNNPIAFIREFWNLAVMPPAAKYGLSWNVPWYDGADYLVATFFLHISVLAWAARLYDRARKTGLAPHLAAGFWSVLFLYFSIYLFRPASPRLLRPMPLGKDSVQYSTGPTTSTSKSATLYYDPLHMISIFFLLGYSALACHSRCHHRGYIASGVLSVKSTRCWWRVRARIAHSSSGAGRWASTPTRTTFTCGRGGLQHSVPSPVQLVSSSVAHSSTTGFVWAQGAQIVAPMSTEDWSQYVFSK